MSKKPFVSIVGAGPGDPELISVKGLNAIRKADVILYDALIDDALLDFASPACKTIYVGKRSGRHSLRQDDINLLIVQNALEHGHVVRLKGGDPFVFGRGHEELEYVRAFDIDLEVIPGISSTTGLATFTEVPLTKRHISESFWVLTGTTKSHQLSSDLQLACRSTATLVILMAIRKVDQVMDLLIENNRGQVAVMIVQNGSMKGQHVVLSTAAEMKYRKKDLIPGAPGIIVVGDVVELHPEYVHAKSIATWL